MAESSRELKRAAGWPLHMDAVTHVNTLLHAAYDSRFSPLEAWLDDVDHLIVVSPDLNQGSPVTAWIDAEGRSLADRFSITYAPSSLLYADLAFSSGPLSPPADWRALLVAGWEPPASAASEQLRASARTEIEGIAALMPRSTVLEGDSASAAQLRTLGAEGVLSDCNLIHLASHAVADQFWLGRSSLLLSSSASPNRPADTQSRDPRESREPAVSTDDAGSSELEMRDIVSAWRLRCELVTLASCYSVLGVRSSNDGYLGLPYAFLSAGARNVVASLWPVDDTATALLMERFYENLVRAGSQIDADPSAASPIRRNRQIARALRDASLWLREWRAEDGTRPYQHPIYWAGFVLLSGGSPAPSDSSNAAVSPSEPKSKSM
jgi:CHAT domain-containing protein